MELAHLHDLIEMEEHYWWHVAKRQLVVQLLQRYFPAPGVLVEGGIGSGRNLSEFQQLGYQVKGLDVMSEAVERGKQIGLNDVRQHDLERAWPWDAGSVQAVVLLDVLEHLADPVQALKNAAAALRPDGGLIVTVPAYPWLFSDWDKRLGHHRRYTAKLLKENVAAASLKIAYLSHWNSFTLPGAVFVRGLDRLLSRERKAEFPRVSSVVNHALLASAAFERFWMRWLRVPLGLSLVAVITK